MQRIAPASRACAEALESRRLLVGNTASDLAAVASFGDDPRHLLAAGDTIFFAGKDAAHGTELWKTDGTAQGTVMVRDIRTGTASSRLAQFTLLDGVVYFVADDGVSGAELWKSDGTEAGTAMVVDLNPGDLSSSPANLAAVNGRLFFRAAVPAGVLWSSDGTAAGTHPFDDTWQVREQPNSFFGFGGKTFMFNVLGLWSTSGEAGTNRLVFQTVVTDDANPVTIWNNRFLFTTWSGRFLWISDGTTAGTRLVTSFDTLGRNYYSRSMIAVGDVVYLIGEDEATGVELWRTDGTAAGTHIIRDINPGPADSLDEISYSAAHQFVEFGGRVVFSADDGVHGRELWTSDGTWQGTRLLKDITSGPASLAPFTFVKVGDTAFFNSYFGLGRTDGSLERSVLTTDTSVKLKAGDDYAIVGNRIYFGWEKTLYTLSTADNQPPTLLGVSGNFLTPKASLGFQFSEDVSASIVPGAFRFENLTTGVVVPPSQFTVAASTFNGTGGAIVAAGGIPDGDYRVTFGEAPIHDAFGNEFVGSFTYHSFVLAGDVDRDRMVGPVDVRLLSTWFNTPRTNETYLAPDVDDSGRIDMNDFAIVASQFGHALPPLSTGAPPPRNHVALIGLLNDDEFGGGIRS